MSFKMSGGVDMANENMKISQNGRNLIKEFEGMRLTAYQDSVGVWTIGYGHTKGVYPGMQITEQQANAFLDEDIKTHAVGIFNFVTVQLNQNQFDALVSFHFNLGPYILQGSNLLVFINNRNWQSAANEMMAYVNAGGEVLPGLVRRRKAESELFLSGNLPPVDGGTTQQKGEIEMKCLYRIDGKGAVFYFDGTSVRALSFPDEMTVIKLIYKANNGSDIPFFEWTNAARWDKRLKDVLSIPKEF